MLARRRQLPAMLEPPYHISEVPKAKKDLSTSVVSQMKPENREEWLRYMPEMVLLCNEAVDRSASKGGGDKDLEEERHKPIDLEYLADRLDTDGGNPLARSPTSLVPGFGLRRGSPTISQIHCVATWCGRRQKAGFRASSLSPASRHGSATSRGTRLYRKRAYSTVGVLCPRPLNPANPTHREACDTRSHGSLRWLPPAKIPPPILTPARSG